jgi:hypothetical protein
MRVMSKAIILIVRSVAASLVLLLTIAMVDGIQPQGTEWIQVLLPWFMILSLHAVLWPHQQARRMLVARRLAPRQRLSFAALTGLALIAGAIDLRSYWHGEAVDMEVPSIGRIRLHSHHGWLNFQLTCGGRRPRGSGVRFDSRSINPYLRTTPYGSLRIWEFSRDANNKYTHFEVSVPYRTITAAWMIVGICLIWRAYHNGARLATHCRNCLYDLTGNLSGICPECGAATRCKEES